MAYFYTILAPRVGTRYNYLYILLVNEHIRAYNKQQNLSVIKLKESLGSIIRFDLARMNLEQLFQINELATLVSQCIRYVDDLFLLRYDIFTIFQ